MSAPRRWKDCDEIDSFARELLDAAEPTRPLPAPRRARIARRLERLAPGAAAGAVGSALGLGSMKGAAAAFGVGLCSAMGVLAVGAALRLPWLGGGEPRHDGGRPALRIPSRGERVAAPASARTGELSTSVAPEAPPPLVAAAETPPSDGPLALAPVALASPRLPPEVTSTSARPTKKGAASRSPSVDEEPQGTNAEDRRAAPVRASLPDLSGELALILEARRLLPEHPIEALAALEKHARAYPGGTMSLERDVLYVEALDQAGRHELAAGRARDLLSRGAPGIYEPRLRRILEEGAAPAGSR